MFFRVKNRQFFLKHYLFACVGLFLFLTFFAKSQEKLEVPADAELLLSNKNLGLTQSDLSCLDYEIKTRRAAWTQMEMYQFLSKNPKAVYLLDNYEQNKNKIDLEKAYEQIKKENFYENFIPDVSLEGELYMGLDKEFQIKGLTIGGAKLKASVSNSATWSGEDLAKMFFENDYVQNSKGFLEPKISYYSKNLTHDIYECEKNNLCRINTDPVYRHLYKVIFQGLSLQKTDKLFPDFPEIERVIHGKQEYLSFEEMKLKSPETAGFVDRIFTKDENSKDLAESLQKTDEVLKSSKELKSIFIKYFQEQEGQIQEKREQIQQSQIDQALYIADGKDRKLKNLEQEKISMEQGLQALEDQYKNKKISSDYYDQQKDYLKQRISNKDNEIKLHKFRFISSEFKSWVGAGIALAQLTGVPQEVIQVGQAVYVGVDIFTGLGSLFVAGGLDPSGITMAIAGISALMSIYKNTGPSVDQIILDELSKIKSNQVKMLQSLDSIEGGVADIKNHLVQLEFVLNKNHKEILEEFSQVKIELSSINNRITSSLAEVKDAQQTLMMENTKTANVSNEAAKYFRQDTLDDLYNDCHYDYQIRLNLFNSKDKSLTETYVCLDQCISNKRKNREADFHSCENNCLPPEGSGCDSTCIHQIISQKIYLRTPYEDCRRNADNRLLTLELELQGIYEDANQLDKGIFVVTSEKKQQNIVNNQEEESKNDEEPESFQIAEALSQNIENRVNTLFKVGEYLGQTIGGNNSNFKETLWNESSLENYEEVLQTTKDILKNPKHLDENFSVYVSSMNRLPSPDTPLGIDGERYRYRLNHLGELCRDVQNIEQVSTVSRANIQNTVILLEFYTNQLIESLKLKFTGIFKEYPSRNEIQNPKLSSNAQASKDCDCNKDYTGFLTGVIPEIKKKNSVIDLFSKSPEDIAKEVSEIFSDEQIEALGFQKTLRHEDQCYQPQGQRPGLKEAQLTNSTQVKLLEDTLRDVQYGDQGSCWFIDSGGLVTGSPGETIQLYQMTGIDDIGYSAPEVVCPIFVTALRDLWFLWADWGEPTKRAICLKTELDLLYDENFFSEGEKHLYWLTKTEVEEGLKPRPLSAKLYMESLIDFAGYPTDSETKEDAKKDLEKIEYSDNGIYVIDGESQYLEVLSYFRFEKDMFMADWDTDFNMNIDITNNRNNIGDQQWMANVEKNRDSFGSCYEDSYACLKAKDVPIFGADRGQWVKSAVTEINSFKTNLENQIKRGTPLDTTDKKIAFDVQIENIKKLSYSLDTLIQVGYGYDPLTNQEKLNDLNKLLSDTQRFATRLFKNNNSFDTQVRTIAELEVLLKNTVNRIQQDQSSKENQLIPLVSSKEYGFGLPVQRAQALQTIRSDFKTKQCSYQEGM